MMPANHNASRLADADRAAEAVRFLLRAAAGKGYSWGFTPTEDGVKLFITGIRGEDLFEALTRLMETPR